MNRRLVILDFVLLLFAAGLVWMLRAHYLEARAREAAVLNKKLPPKPVLAPPLPAPARPAPSSEYIDVAQRMLFSKDRNPTVVVEAPKPPPEPVMPPLPIYHGQMAIGEPIALLSLVSQAGAQKGYHAGDNVGDFKLIAFDEQKIELEWHGKKIERKPEELVAKEVTPPPAPAAGAQAAANGAPAAARPANAAPDQPSAAPPKAVTSLGSTGASSSGAPPSGMGDQIDTGVRACAPGDDSPAGTVLNGYQKRIIPSMFGPICRWEQVK